MGPASPHFMDEQTERLREGFKVTQPVQSVPAGIQGRSNLKPELGVAIPGCCCWEALGRTHLDASALMAIARVHQISPLGLRSISSSSGDRRECINVPKRAQVPERNVTCLHSLGAQQYWV